MVDTTISECLSCLLKTKAVCYKCKKKFCLYHYTTEDGTRVQIVGFSVKWACHKCSNAVPKSYKR